MDAYQQQQHRYLRPPPPQPPQPPPTMDPHHHYHHQYPQPPRAPTPQPSYYPNQFQYQHHQSHSSPSPPPPAPSQWGPPPPTVPYPGHPHGAAAGNQFLPLPPRPHLPPPQIPHSYPHHQVNQEWSNPNWSYHHGWDYSAHNNVEDWGAKAREWANARAAMQEQQQPQSQFTPVGRPEDQNRFHDQYQQAVDTNYQDGQQQSLPTLNYQQFPAPAASPHVPPMMYPQESLSGNSASSYNIADGHQTYQVKDGTSAVDSNAGFLHQESLFIASSIHQQEVPSSYSSVSEKEDLAVSSAQESQQLQTSVAAGGRSGTIESSFMYGSQAVDPAADLSDRPLDFAPRFNEHDPHIHSSFTAHHESVGVGRGIEPVTAVPSINAWTPAVAPPAVYPPIPPVLPLGAQHDPSMALPSLSGHAAPPFGRFPGPNFQPTIPTASASFDLGTGAPLHPSAAFPGDTYGSVSDRPKKAPMPNWLKEEIIKNKAAIAKSSLEHPKEETQSIEDDVVDKSFGKGDQADGKSVDSSRSAEEEDDDEDYVEAARTAAINQEIKRVLTEVLLKVTDELFDEIATKVLSEDDLTVEVNHNNLNSRPSPQAVPTAKASASVVVPGKGKESDGVGLSEKSTSSSPGDVLGLANYASDDDDDDETQSSMPESRNNSILEPSCSKRLSENMVDAAENGNFHVESNENFRSEKNLGSDLIQPKENKNAAVAGLGENGADRVHEHSYSSRMVSRNEINASSEKPRDGNNGSQLNDTLGEKVMATSELPEKDTSKKSRKDDSQGRESGLKSDKNDRHENRKSSGKDSGREVEISRVREDEKGDENRQRQDERHLRKEKADDWNGLKQHGVKTGNKAKESESQRRSNHLEAKDEKKDAERSHRAGAKEEVERKRGQTKEDDRARHKLGSDSSRHKRRRSLSPSTRGRSSKDNSGSHVNDSSDEVSDDSKRKLHSRRPNSSPSPVRSRRRQVSRSPHSKHSQRRHSPYSSLDTTSTRGRRSRSRSPGRRQR